MKSKKRKSYKKTKVIIAPVDKVVIYEVNENELEILKNGGTNERFLNISLSLLSIGLTTLGITLSITFLNSFIANLILHIGSATLFGGLICLYVWLQNKKSISTVYKSIKDRLPP